MSRLPTPVGFGKQPNVDGIDVAGAMRNIIAVTQADYTVKPGDGNPIIYVETGASDRVIYLPATPADVEGVMVTVVKTDSGAGSVIISGNGNNVSGVASIALDYQYNKAEVSARSGAYYVLTDNWSTLTGTGPLLSKQEYQDGYDDAISGGTTTPTAPTIAANALGREITVTIPRQNDLTNFSFNEIQVSDDQVSWYAPRNDGVDWKGTLNGTDLTEDTFYHHRNIPLLAGNLPRLLYYRARRTTSAPAQSAYSGVASASATYVAADSVDATVPSTPGAPTFNSSATYQSTDGATLGSIGRRLGRSAEARSRQTPAHFGSCQSDGSVSYLDHGATLVCGTMRRIGRRSSSTDSN